MRYDEKFTIRSFPALKQKLQRRADAEGHGNVSVAARTILARALKVKLPSRTSDRREP